MANDNLIKELDFVLTHPSCSVVNLDSFYNSCLFLYETVPLVDIVNHMRKEKPRLLFEWSTKNKTVNQVLSDMGIQLEEHGKDPKNRIVITTDLHSLRQASNGYYILVWSTDIDEEKINAFFKRKTLIVKCKAAGEMELVGFVKAEGKNQYNLYLKMKEE